MADPRSIIKVIEGLAEAEQKAAEFIKDGPSTGLPGHIRDGYRRRCEQLSRAPGWAQLLLTSGASPYGRVCEPYLNESGWDKPTIGPSFTGGQCETLYNIDGSVTVYDNACTATTQTIDLNGIPGPISNVRYDNSGSVGNAPPTCPQALGTAAFITDGNGIKITLAGSGGGVNNATISVSRVDGNPDDCGNPEDVLIPGPNPAPDPGPIPGPEPFADPTAPTGPPIVPIPPYEEPGQPPQPILDPNLPPDSFDPTQVPGSDAGQPGEEPQIGTAIGAPAPSGEEGADLNFGEPPDGFVWVGAVFQITSTPDYGSIAGSRPENRVFPRTIGNMSLKYGSRRGKATQIRSAWHDVSRENDFLLVTGCFINTLPGISFRVYPLKQPKCPENECSED